MIIKIVEYNFSQCMRGKRIRERDRETGRQRERETEREKERYNEREKGKEEIQRILRNRKNPPSHPTVEKCARIV